MATHGLLVVLYHAFQIMQTSGLAIREFPGTLAYSDADTFCRSQGMRLPVLTSPYSQSLALGALGPSPESEYWIGLDYITGDFRWADNSPLCWKNWFVSSANEPNNLNSELCVAMRGGGSVPGSWLTKSCSRTFGVICERPQPGITFTIKWKTSRLPEQLLRHFRSLRKQHVSGSVRLPATA
ncbi:C-type mannose receptor 2-like isoform X2 [Haliotis rufescens]|uniref:C-type mannose receptor 2-like isoform X2 n=1 Tax=Haliotis rufescens TaxID=6454 RepID=UPI00201EDE8C|nr:C-type mannose receptor 2-like isoform X2 [Haliotis rufescens]